MARQLRLQYPGAMYHLMSRGDHLEAVFREVEDRRLFLCTLGESCGKTDWQIHAYGLMSNHFHLVAMGSWKAVNRRLYEQRQAQS